MALMIAHSWLKCHMVSNCGCTHIFLSTTRSFFLPLTSKHVKAHSRRWCSLNMLAEYQQSILVIVVLAVVGILYWPCWTNVITLPEFDTYHVNLCVCFIYWHETAWWHCCTCPVMKLLHVPSDDTAARAQCATQWTEVEREISWAPLRLTAVHQSAAAFRTKAHSGVTVLKQKLLLLMVF